jgi:hypothetical protein
VKDRRWYQQRLGIPVDCVSCGTMKNGRIGAYLVIDEILGEGLNHKLLSFFLLPGVSF